MKRRAITAMLVVGGLAAGLLAGCASGDKKMSGSGDVVADRQQLMKKQGAAMQDITTKLRAGSLDGVAANADVLVDTSKAIPGLFPAGSTSPKSRAKPEIWQKKAEFDGYARSLGEQAGKVAGLARANNLAGTQAAVAEMGRTTCGACHNAFRGPEIKS